MFDMSREVMRYPTKFIYILAALILAACAAPEKPKEQPPLVYPPPPEEPRYYYERTITSSFDVKEITAGDRFRMAVTGSAGSASGLSKPYGIAVYQGRIYVSDTVQRIVFMFDVPGKDFKVIGTEGPGALNKPIGLTVSRDGELYVCDNSGKRVVVYDKDGNYLRAIGGAEYFSRPSGVAVSPDGAKLYVIDTGGVDNYEHHRFTIWNTKTGAFIKAVGRRGSEAGEFNLALQIATAPDGTVYVVDGGNFRVQAFTADGQFIRKVGAVGIKTGQFSRPKGIAVDRDGNFYVIDTGFGNFQIFSKEGQLLLFVGTRGSNGGPGEYMLPAGIAVDEDGRVYMVDQYFRKVDVFRPARLQPDEGWLSTKNKSGKKK